MQYFIFQTVPSWINLVPASFNDVQKRNLFKLKCVLCVHLNKRLRNKYTFIFPQVHLNAEKQIILKCASRCFKLKDLNGVKMHEWINEWAHKSFSYVNQFNKKLCWGNILEHRVCKKCKRILKVNWNWEFIKYQVSLI